MSVRVPAIPGETCKETLADKCPVKEYGPMSYLQYPQEPTFVVPQEDSPGTCACKGSRSYVIDGTHP